MKADFDTWARLMKAADTFSMDYESEARTHVAMAAEVREMMAHQRNESERHTALAEYRAAYGCPRDCRGGCSACDDGCADANP